MPRIERLSKAPRPLCCDHAFAHSDSGSPVRDHWVCYCVSNNPKQYAVLSLSSEDTDYFEYNGLPAEKRGLIPSAVYRVQESDLTSGYDQIHLIICLPHKSIELTGEDAAILGPVAGESAESVLVRAMTGTLGKTPMLAIV